MAKAARKTTRKSDEARISIRAKADLRHTISLAADLSGLDLSNFIKSVALQRANEVIREHETMRIASPEQRAAFREALNAPGRSIPALAELLKTPPTLNAVKR